MAGKTANWKPGPTVCRCCLAEGCYKDISTEYFWMGKREVYAEMLTNTFNVSIAFSQSGGPNSNSRLICEPCISRLRDASNFKRQVLDCEKTFMQHLDPGSSLSHQDLPEELAGLDDAVKVERVKIERDAPSDDDFDATPDFLDDDDDELDQPLTNFATKEPKKEAVSLLEELLDNPAVTIKKKSVVKTKQPPAKKVKRTETAKPTSSKVVVKTATAEKKKKEMKRVRNPVKRNAQILLEYTTLYPFRYKGNALMCVYCYEEFEEPEMLRQHRDETHPTVNLFTAFYHTGSGEVYKIHLKVDCVDLKCRICLQPLDTIEDAAKHLKENHDNADIRALNLNEKLGVMPFKLIKSNLICLICASKMPTVNKLCRHMATHFTTVTCEICGRHYASQENLKNHVRCSHSGKVLCKKCWQEFPDAEKRREHIANSPKCKPFACVYCGERFLSWEQKNKHLMANHQVDQVTYSCPECGLVFTNRKVFYEHYGTEHTENGFTCIVCKKGFLSRHRFDDHMAGHTGDKQHICPECYKPFSRLKSLKQHMWTHKEDKRFICGLCNKQFNQKISLIGHNKTHHPHIEF